MHDGLGWLSRTIAGFLIGIGCVLPGVSGGVMAVSFGLYKPMLDALLDFFHNPMGHLRFLFPLAIGGGAGVLLGAKGLGLMMNRHGEFMLFLFCGFIVGGLPQLWSEMHQGKTWRLTRLGWMLGGIVLALPLALLGGQGNPLPRLSPLQGLITGLLEGIGTVIPGLSTSLVLIRLGWYEAYLSAMSGLDWALLSVIGIGFIVSALLCMKAIQWLFNHHPGPSYAVVLGFLLVSLMLALPPMHQGTLLWADLALMLIGAICARWLEQLSFHKGVNP